MASSKEQRVALDEINKYLQILHFPFYEDGSPTAWVTAVGEALWEFHERLPQHQTVRAQKRRAFDEVFHDFLRQHGKILLGSRSEFRRLSFRVLGGKVPVYRPGMTTVEANEIFRPLREALWHLTQVQEALKHLTQERKKRQKRGFMAESNNAKPDDANTQSIDIYTRFPEYSQDDLRDDEHSEVTKDVSQRPWILRYLPGDPRPFGYDNASTTSYPVVRRICKEDPNGDWYVHWTHKGHKTWQLLRWNISDQNYHLHHRDGSTQRIQLVQQGGMPGSFVHDSEGRLILNGNNNGLDDELEANEPHERRSQDAYSKSDSDTDKSTSSLSTRPQGSKRNPQLSSPSSSTSKLRKGGRLSRLRNDRLELLRSGCVHAKVSQALRGPRDHDTKRQSAYTERVCTKTTHRQVAVVPCILNDQFVWGEWSYGKLSSLSVDELFARVAESYGVENNSNLEEVKFHLIDLVPEKTYVVRRHSALDLEQMMTRIREEVMAKSEHQTSFWVGMRPVIEIAESKLDVDI